LPFSAATAAAYERTAGSRVARATGGGPLGPTAARPRRVRPPG
jgi:hypothetical protein